LDGRQKAVVPARRPDRICKPDLPSRERILLDDNSLARLSAHFEALLRSIQNRINVVSSIADSVAFVLFINDLIHAHDGLSAVNSIAKADAEIASMRNIIAQINELEGEFDKAKHIRDAIRQLNRFRIEVMERKIRPIAQTVTG
jgi:hypothetical protein